MSLQARSILAKRIYKETFQFRAYQQAVMTLVFLFRTAMYLSYTEEGVVIEDDVSLEHDLNIEWSINLGTIGDDPGMLANDMLRRSGDLSGPAPRLF